MTDPELETLRERVARLEDELAALRALVRPPIPEDVVLAISAAVAAFLGKRATVRQIHLAGDTAWAQEGRSYVHSSHSEGSFRH